jgi:RND family efflux transporter MFP subunit
MSIREAPRTADPLSRLRIQRPAERPRRWLGRWIWRAIWLAILIAVVGAGAMFWTQGAGWTDEWLEVPEAIRPRPEVRVATVIVESGRSADALVVATGYLESRRQAKIGARAPGRIEAVNVEEGSRVTRDEILAVLEHADLLASLEATWATLERSKAELGEQEVEIARTATELARSEKLFGRKSISESDYDKVRFEHRAAVARRDSLKAAIELAAARVREAERLKENMYIRAPFDGTVISKDAEVGESILPGGLGDASGRGSVVTIADLAHLEVDCDVKEDYIARVEVGQSAEVAVDAVPKHRYQGRVRKIIPMGDRARATIKVKVEILDVDGRLFPEMSSTVYFLPAGSDAQAAPANQIKEKRVFARTAAISKDDSGSYVWVVGDGERLARVAVATGGELDGRTEIAEGLAGGERVVVDPPPALRAGQLVKISD